MLVLASLVLGFATFDTLSVSVVVWLRLTPMCPCLSVTIWNVSPGTRSLHACPSFFFFHSAWWYACHACLCHPLAFCASLHACLHVHAWVLLDSASSMLQQNEVMDIRSKPTFVPRGHQLLFIFLLVCFYACLLTFLLCLPSLSHSSILCLFCILFASFPSITCLLVSCLCLCMHTHGAWGRMELGDGFLGASKRGANISM